MKNEKKDIKHSKCLNCGAKIIPEMEFMECQKCDSWDKSTEEEE